MFPEVDREIDIYNSTVDARPGYFSVKMVSSIKAEMTVTNHTALYRFTFPETPVEKNAPLSPLILADLNDLPLSRINGSVCVNNDTGRIFGSGTFR